MEVFSTTIAVSEDTAKYFKRIFLQYQIYVETEEMHNIEAWREYNGGEMPFENN